MRTGGAFGRIYGSRLTAKSGPDPESRTLTSENSILTTLAATIALAVAGPLHHAPSHGGCHTHACDVRVAHARSVRLRHKLSRLDSFTICVFNHESGAPEDPYDPSHIRWHLKDQGEGGHTGAGQWDPETWHEGGGRTPEAWEATPSEQTYVFRTFYPGHESRWQQTAPLC